LILYGDLFLVSFDKLSGKFVICAGGFDLGEINEVDIDTDNWKVTHLHVKLSKQASEDLGFKKRFRSSTVCFPVSLVSKVGDNILLNKCLDELSKSQEISECQE
jgi:sporulation protein YlmC with PRC-barrel domain